MAKKRNGLISKALSAPTVARRPGGVVGWWDRLPPDEREQVDELIDLYNAKDRELLKRYPSMASLFRFLKEQLPDRPISRSGFGDYVRTRREQASR